MRGAGIMTGRCWERRRESDIVKKKDELLFVTLTHRKIYARNRESFDCALYINAL